jgi:hypothetical protein
MARPMARNIKEEEKGEVVGRGEQCVERAA